MEQFDDGLMNVRTGDRRHDHLLLARAIRLLLWVGSSADDNGLGRAAVALRAAGEAALADGDHGQAEAGVILGLASAVQAAADAEGLDAGLRQMRRRQALRERLLAGALTPADVAARQGVGLPAAERWMADEAAAQRLVVVSTIDGLRVPSIFIDEEGRLRPGFEQVLRPLRSLSAWATWMWLVTPSGWLSGSIPAELIADGEVDRVAAAAARFASRAGREPAVE
jgi:hypothetical protein